MNKALAFFAISLTVFASGCLGRGWFEYTVDVNTTKTYFINQDGFFNTSSDISRYDIANALGLPADAKVEEINIQELSIHVSKLFGNTAQFLNLTGVINDFVTPPDFLWENFFLGLDFPGTELNANVNYLNARGIGRLKKTLEDFLKGSGNYPLTRISLSGNPEENGHLELSIDLSIKATVKYGRCEELPIFVVEEKGCP